MKNNDRNIDVVLVAKDITENLKEFYEKLSFGNNLKVVSSLKNKEKFPDIEIIDECVFLDRTKFINLAKDMGLERPEWYYQQFLKYCIIEKSSAEGVHIIDGDTSVAIEMIGVRALFYNPRKKANSRYKEFIGRFFKNSLEDKCFVTNQMFFEKKWFTQLLEFLGPNWMERLLNEISNEKRFSEYQFFAEFLIQQNNYNVSPARVFRRFDLIRLPIDVGLKKYDILAWEPQHKTGFLRTIRAKMYYFIGINLG